MLKSVKIIFVKNNLRRTHHMNKKTVKDVELNGKKVLVRVDLTYQ